MQGTFLLLHRVLRAMNLVKILNDNIVFIIDSYIRPQQSSTRRQQANCRLSSPTMSAIKLFKEGKAEVVEGGEGKQ